MIITLCKKNKIFSLLQGWEYVPYSNSYALNTELQSDLLWHVREKSYVHVKVIKDNAIKTTLNCECEKFLGKKCAYFGMKLLNIY